MGLFDGLLGGGDPLDAYGDLFTEKQKAALQQRQMGEGLLRLAGAFGQAAQPSRMPTSFLGTLGQAAGAMAGHGDETAKTALSGMKVAEDVRASRQRRELVAKATPIVQALIAAGIDPHSPVGQQVLAAAGVPANAAAPAAPPGAAVPTGAPPPAGAPPPGSGYPGPTNEELGAPPTAAPPLTRASYAGAPAGGGDQWLQQNAPFPTLQRPNAQPIQWSNEPPKVPFGQDPGDFLPGTPRQQTGLLPPQDQVVGPDGRPLTGPGVLPRLAAGGGAPLPFRLASATSSPSDATPGATGPDAGRQGRVDFWMSQGAPRHVAEGIADRVKAESSFNPSEIGDNGTSGGLYQHHAGRLAQLKQFAAQQGRPWTDPNVQDQFAATEVKGGDAIATRGWSQIVNAPDRETAAKLWDRHFERSAAGPGARGGQDTVIPSGRGIPASALRNVADTGAAAPGAPAASGFIPGLGITPQGLGALNALLKMGGVDSPFESVLDTYYKSPGYLGEKARTEAEARRSVDLKLGPQIKEAETLAELNAKLQLQPKLEAAIETAKNDPRLAFEEKKATIERYTKELEQLRGAGLEPVEVTVRFPGESTPRKITITKAQLPELASGKGIPALGIPQMTGVNLGQPVFTPGQEAEQKGAAESRVKLVQGYREQADLSADAKTTLQGISAEIGNMVHGPFAPAAQLASSYLRIVDPGFNKQVSSYEELYSNANELVRKAVRQSDPNPSFIQTQMAMDAMPVPSRSPEGLAKITNRMIGVNDHNIARAAAIPYYQANVGNGSVEGFDSWWRKSVSPYAFVFGKMSPDDQVALVSRLNATGQGKREVEKLKTQLGFIKQYGLEQ